MNSILFQYKPTTIYINQYEKTVNNGGYIKIPFVSGSSNEPNLVVGSLKYTTQNLYITGNIHKLKDKNDILYDGELIIEHTPITNSDINVMVVFPLKITDDPKKENKNLHKIIEQAFTTQILFDISLNSNVSLSGKYKTDKSVFIMDDANYFPILLWNNPVNKNPLFKLFSTEPVLFPIFNNTQYKPIQFLHLATPKDNENDISQITEGFKISSSDIIKSNDEDNNLTKPQYLKCKPSNYSDPEMNKKLMVPLSFNNNLDSTAAYSIILAGVISVVISIALIPAYKTLMDKVKSNNDVSTKFVFNFMTVFLILLFIFVVIPICSYFFISTLTIYKYIGIVISVFSVIVILILFLYTLFINNNNDGQTVDDANFYKVIISFISKLFNMNKGWGIRIIQIILFFLFIVFLVLHNIFNSTQYIFLIFLGLLSFISLISVFMSLNN